MKHFILRIIYIFLTRRIFCTLFKYNLQMIKRTCPETQVCKGDCDIHGICIFFSLFISATNNFKETNMVSKVLQLMMLYVIFTRSTYYTQTTLDEPPSDDEDEEIYNCR